MIARAIRADDPFLPENPAMSLSDLFGHLTLPDIIGYVGNVVVIITYSMRTMIPLRILGMCSNAIFLTYAAMLGLFPLLVLNCIILPLNGFRLWQMLRLTRQVRDAAAVGDASMSWLKPFMTKRSCRAGEILFRKNDEAKEMFFTVSGRFSLVESGIALPPGQVVGELGLLSPDRRRTQSLRCDADGDVLVISYSEVRQLYFQNPEFGFYFLHLASGRLFQNIRMLEDQLAAREELPPDALASETA
jgi:hypothetical protein